MQEDDAYDVVSTGVEGYQEEQALRKWRAREPLPYHMIRGFKGRYWAVLGIVLFVAGVFIFNDVTGRVPHPDGPCFYGANC